MASLLIIFVVPLFLTLAWKILRYNGIVEKAKFPYFWNVFVYLNAFSQKDAEQEPIFLSTRIIFLIMFYSSVMLFNAFSASYTSFLSVVQVAQPFNSISELEKTDYIIGGPSGSSYKSNFEVQMKS